MTDEQLIEKRLAFIETCLQQLASLGKPEAIETDVKERRFIEHTATRPSTPPSCETWSKTTSASSRSSSPRFALVFVESLALTAPFDIINIEIESKRGIVVDP